MIPFLRKHITGDELKNLQDLVMNSDLESEGRYSTLCTNFLKKRYGFRQVLLTSSSTAALEMSAVLMNLTSKNEVIIPSYTYVSTATSFLITGSVIRYADSRKDHPNVSAESIRKQISYHSKVIVPVHYGGVGCDMPEIMKIADEHGLYVVEDAAHAIDSKLNGKALGTFGHLGVISFHDTKNIFAGKGGALIINDPELAERAEVLFENGTNRNEFYKGKAEKYEWTDFGSSYHMSEFNAAVLYAQLCHIDALQEKRLKIWKRYHNELQNSEGKIQLAQISPQNEHNAHLYYIVLESKTERDRFIQYMKEKEIDCRFHFQGLHLSRFGKKYRTEANPACEKFTNGLVRLPIYPDLTEEEQTRVISAISDFANKI
ncbi:MAG: dTDP-4-amino-4,6-dideoxygalactose transaminase [Bacteroidetes bacterium GWF2_38_335]|nr:MAG: dTDP-4-amino-4,6-dideoxygalactose transaminase [Bacteroidetes bacterium GWF2_38_335]OFY80641.1 MAG: dTDP-4-amino-4,6-dideoxygalactose transaminase [Bacteroidetes bacterium RIFOXYA12_FULL_38_20]HBS86982.1 dTDP-4-amino-4,6-dideoxygalactose transaminase [Bacteroidales bacterium]